MGGGNSNTTISYPGSGWEVLWTDSFDDFQLDIVGFLAILGEGAVQANAQVAALSPFFYLPRLMPAPQALLWPSRPSTLSSEKATVSAVHSGQVTDHIHHVANVLLHCEMDPFTVRCVHIKKRKSKARSESSIIEKLGIGKPKRSRRLSDTIDYDPPDVKARRLGPLTVVLFTGFSLSIMLFILSITFGDGWSVLATVLLSLLSTLVAIGNGWVLKLPQRPKTKMPLPEGDLVIRYPNGSYLVVKCSAGVARELFFAPEEIQYNIKSVAVYRLISLAGTLMLMFGVIALANSRLQLQIAWTGSYVVMNIAHWIAAALPNKLHWDLGCYEVNEESLSTGPRNLTFTEALWKAILLARSTGWVRGGRAAPETVVWDQWLREAEVQAEGAKSRVGLLKDHLWPESLTSKGPIEGTVWDVPEWDAKGAWDDMNARHRKEFQTV